MGQENLELNLGNRISKYYQSFSGTDTLAFIMMPGTNPVLIGSLTTISYSMYRNKKPVINIGRTNINGVTRGARIFAGTMIFTLINQHWLKELQEQVDWLKNYKDLKVDELPLFDILIMSANEYGNAVTMHIFGIDFTDEAQTISVEDLFTENVFSFIARDVSNFKKVNISPKYTEKMESENTAAKEKTQRFYILDSSAADFNDVAKIEKSMTLAKIQQLEQDSRNHTLSRELYFSSSKLMIGNDVAEIQTLLNQLMPMPIAVTGIFDNETDEAVRKYQSNIGEYINGVVDDKIYNSLINKVSGDTKYGVVVNKYGAFVYGQPNLLSDIVDTKAYKEQIIIDGIIIDDSENSNTWYKINSGYILMEDIYSSYYSGSTIEFPKIKYGDNSAYVTMVQTALSKIYPDFTDITGEYDYTTQNYIKQFQKDNGLINTGVVDNDTWLLLQGFSGNISTELSNDNFKIEMQTPPGTYNISSNNILNESQMFNATISCDNYIPVKISTICIYDDKISETLTKTVSIKDAQTISLREFQNAFVYNPKYGKTPIQIDYIIYPHNKKPFKWTIIYS